MFCLFPGVFQKAEEWLKKEDPHAFRLREDIMKVLGAPGSNIRPEGSVVAL